MRPVPGPIQEAVDALAHPSLHPLSAQQVQAAIKVGAADLMEQTRREGAVFQAVRDALPSAIPEGTEARHLLVASLALAAQAANLMAEGEAARTGMHPLGVRRLICGIAAFIMGDFSDQWVAKTYEEGQKTDGG